MSVIKSLCINTTSSDLWQNYSLSQSRWMTLPFCQRQRAEKNTHPQNILFPAPGRLEFEELQSCLAEMKHSYSQESGQGKFTGFCELSLPSVPANWCLQPGASPAAVRSTPSPCLQALGKMQDFCRMIHPAQFKPGEIKLKMAGFTTSSKGVPTHCSYSSFPVPIWSRHWSHPLSFSLFFTQVQAE